MRRRLIINADDFGLTHGINRSVAEAHVDGVLTSATMMAHAPAFAEAVLLSQAHNKLSVGCHVVLVDGEPLTDPERLPGLVPRGSTRFRASIGDVALRALSGRLDQDRIEAEATAQFRKLQSQGVCISHFDTHKHTHVFPRILEAILRAARTCGIQALRNPFEPLHPLPATLLRSRPDLWKRYAQTRSLRLLQGQFRRMVARAGLRTTDGTLGIIGTGLLDATLFAAIVQNMPEGTWEFVCHPGYVDDELAAVNTRLRASREVELSLLTSAETRALLANAGVELISYRQL